MRHTPSGIWGETTWAGATRTRRNTSWARYRIGGAGELTLMPNSLDLTHGPWTREDLEEMWESMQAVLPKDSLSGLSELCALYGRRGGDGGLCAARRPRGSQWEICLDPADMGDRDYFLETVLHEYCHYLTLNHRQADYRGEPTVETYCEDGMVSREGSYLDDFCQRFWTGYLDDRLADLDSYNFFLRHEEDFVSSYASTDRRRTSARASPSSCCGTCRSRRRCGRRSCGFSWTTRS